MKVIETSEVEEKECTSIMDTLLANYDSVIEVSIGSEWVIGKIVSIQQQGNDGLLILKGESSTRIILFSKIVSLRVPVHPPPKLLGGELKEQRMVHRIKQKVKRKTLRVSLKNSPIENSTYELRYITRGLTWSPTYKLILVPIQEAEPQTSGPESTFSSAKTHHKFANFASAATLSFQCFVMNDGEDVRIDNLTISTQDIDLKLFDVRDTLTPKTFSISEFFQAIYKPGSSTSLFPTQLANQSFEEKIGTTSSSHPPEEFYYSDVTLSTNDRLYLPGFDVPVSIKPVTHVHLNSNKTQLYNSLMLTNQSTFTWPAGPISVFHDSHCFGQKNLEYTSKGTYAVIDLFPNRELVVSFKEEEMLDVKEKGGNMFSMIATVMNPKPESIQVVVSYQFIGELISSSSIPDKSFVKLVDGDSVSVKWEFTLLPKASQKVELKRLKK